MSCRVTQLQVSDDASYDGDEEEDPGQCRRVPRCKQPHESHVFSHESPVFTPIKGAMMLEQLQHIRDSQGVSSIVPC